jgi:hypothetical protein
VAGKTTFQLLPSFLPCRWERCAVTVSKTEQLKKRLNVELEIKIITSVSEAV